MKCSFATRGVALRGRQRRLAELQAPRQTAPVLVFSHTCAAPVQGCPRVISPTLAGEQHAEVGVDERFLRAVLTGDKLQRALQQILSARRIVLGQRESRQLVRGPELRVAIAAAAGQVERRLSRLRGTPCQSPVTYALAASSVTWNSPPAGTSCAGSAIAPIISRARAAQNESIWRLPGNSRYAVGRARPHTSGKRRRGRADRTWRAGPDGSESPEKRLVQPVGDLVSLGNERLAGRQLARGQPGKNRGARRR